MHAHPNTFFMLLGSKIDLDDRRQISTETLRAFALAQNVPFAETSSKTGRGVFNAAYTAIKRKLMQIASESYADVPATQRLLRSDNKKSKRMCEIS